MRIEVTKQNEGSSWPNEDTGVDTISLEGNRLHIVGWYESLADWEATVILTNEQLRMLRDAINLET